MSTGNNMMDLLKDINSLMDKGLKNYFAQCGVTVTQLSVINILVKKEKVKLNEISEELRITPAAVSLIINRLENQNVIERVRDTKDKRVVYAKMTDWFKESHKHLDNNIGGFLDILLKSKNSEEVEKIFEGLTLLKNLLDSSDTIISTATKCPHLQESNKKLGGENNER